MCRGMCMCVWGRALHVANSILVIKFFAAHKFDFNALSAPLATDWQAGSQAGSLAGSLGFIV